MFFPSPSSHYDPVNGDDQPQDEKIEGTSISYPQSSAKRRTPRCNPEIQISKSRCSEYHAIAMLCIVFICTLIDMVLISYAIYVIRTNGLSTSTQELQALKLQDTYVSLDSIYLNKSSTDISYGSIINHSRYFTQVSSSNPSEILSSDERLLLHNPGRLPYYGRRLFVNSTASYSA